MQRAQLQLHPAADKEGRDLANRPADQAVHVMPAEHQIIFRRLQPLVLQHHVHILPDFQKLQLHGLPIRLRIPQQQRHGGNRRFDLMRPQGIVFPRLCRRPAGRRQLLPPPPFHGGGQRQIPRFQRIAHLRQGPQKLPGAPLQQRHFLHPAAIGRVIHGRRSQQHGAEYQQRIHRRPPLQAVQAIDRQDQQPADGRQQRGPFSALPVILQHGSAWAR